MSIFTTKCMGKRTILNYLEKQESPSELISSEHLIQIYGAFKYLETVDKSPDNLNTDLRKINRPLLVLAFSIPSFHDTANWPGPSMP